MADAQQNAPTNTDADNTDGDVQVKITKPHVSLDLATTLGLGFAFGVIVLAIVTSQSNAQFFNLPSLLIVVFGTIFVTSISYSFEELSRAGHIIFQSMIQRKTKPNEMARQLLDITMLARKKGFLALSELEPELKKNKHLAKAIQIVTDGYGGDDIERVLGQDLDALVERHRRSASIARRGAEIAPAMGLIGTLVGLVQMLSDLQNPESIGPSMAVALLTTFYGAILGTVILNPLAAKLERNSNEEVRIRSMIMTAMSSIARQENPRRLEMLLNSDLPPDQQIIYFK